MREHAVGLGRGRRLQVHHVDGPVAAALLRGVERLVGAVVQVAPGGFVFERPLGHADADRAPAAVRHRRLADRAQQLDRLARRQRVDRAEQGELLAPQARRADILARSLADQARDLLQHGIADIVAMRVVDDLEAVDIDQEQSRLCGLRAELARKVEQRAAVGYRLADGDESAHRPEQ